MNIARLSDSVELEFARRQLVMKDRHEHSWFNYIKDLLDIYGIPLVFELFENSPSKSEWKELLDNSVNSVIETEWKKRHSRKILPKIC